MASPTLLAANIAISITILIVLIVYAKLHPVIALVIGSLYMGIASGLGLSETVGEIGTGFGNLMAGIGIPIVFGIMIGMLLAKSGGARKIALTLCNTVGKEKVPYAIGMSGLIVSIPVFFDVTFLVIAPMAIAIFKETNVSYPKIIGGLAIGAAGAHTFIPPTPNPLAAATILDFPLGHMMIMGLTLGIAIILLTMWIYFQLIERLDFWNDENDIEEIPFEIEEGEKKEMPSFALSLLPIFIPIFLILINSVIDVYIETPEFIEFLGSRIISLLLGVLAAIGVYLTTRKLENIDDAFYEAMQPAGLVLAITGAGGAFGHVIGYVGAGEALIEGIGIQPGITVVIIAFVLGLIMRIAQGSGTVASITAMSTVAGIGVFGVPGVLVAWAALAGGISIGHLNDSGYWVVTKLAGLEVSGGLKTYTLGGAILAAITFPVALILSLFFI